MKTMLLTAFTALLCHLVPFSVSAGEVSLFGEEPQFQSREQRQEIRQLKREERKARRMAHRNRTGQEAAMKRHSKRMNLEN